jgi:uncharacterized protein (DUF58 family)
MYFQFRTRPGLAGWLTLLTAIALVVVIGIVVATVAVGLFLVLVPLVIFATVLNYFFPRAGFRRPQRTRPGEPNVIDGEFRVVEPCVVEPAAPRIEQRKD